MIAFPIPAFRAKCSVIPLRFLILGLAASPEAQADLEVDRITATATQVEIVVIDHGSESASYQLESNDDLVGLWSPVPATPAVSGNRITFTFPRPPDDSRFYRVVGSGPSTGGPGDIDGDGLADTLEQAGWRITATGPLFTSDPNLFDTDFDGFSDGVEFAYGTNPRSAASKPDQSTLPVVEFAGSLSSVTEGEPSHFIPLTVSGAYAGPVSFSVNARSTASAANGDITPLPVSVTVAAGGITVNVIDDDDLSGERILVLDLASDPPGGGYRRGGRASHVVCISDNDAYWNGVLEDGETERNFRLKMVRGPGGTTVDFVAGSSDGTTAPAGVGGSQSEGIVPTRPTNTWRATSVADLSDRFRVVSPAMPEGSGGTIVKGAGLQRILTLDATDATRIGGQLISGSYEDAIASSDPDKVYLNTTRTGGFILMRDLSAPAEIVSEFRP